MTPNFPSLKWLVLFRTIAACGSVQEAARRLGVSTSTASHQLKSLERHLGVQLVQHDRRPMALTSEGVAYLRHVEGILAALGSAQAEITAPKHAKLVRLRLGIIDDFESDIGPEITRLLNAGLPGCKLLHRTRTSHDILEMLHSGDLDIGIATQPDRPVANLVEHAVLKDPFVLAVPKGLGETALDLVEGRSQLPFLRYGREQIMGRVIEAQLTRLRLKLDDLYELDSTASIMALIAQGNGWAITTPSNFSRAQRFHTQVDLLPFPLQAFARTISVFVANTDTHEIAADISSALRRLLAAQTIAPTVKRFRWLEGRYRIISE